MSATSSAGAVFVLLVVLIAGSSTVQSAAIDTNLVYETPRIGSGDELISQIVNDCFAADTMSCLKGRVLNYLDTQLGVNEEYGRSFEAGKIDEVIFDRSARLLAAQRFRVQLPAVLFDRAALSYTPEGGLDVEVAPEEGRGHLLKKKILLPILLLLKLKMKALMPIFVAMIGFKALKALILSKLAITLVLGFVVYQLIAKKSAMPMPMPMTESPMTAYGVPTSAAASSSYDSSAWDTANSGGPYARVWEPSTSSSAQNLAYSSYYPSSSSSSSSSGSSSLTSGTSSTSSTGGSSSSY